MEWNSSAPMELLAQMPARLTRKNLETIQSVIDNDKYICSTMLGRDLCGDYAPFCVLCDKSMKTPCAVAYIRMKQAEGIQLEIAASDDENDVETADEPVIEEQAPKEVEALETQVEVTEAETQIVNVEVKPQKRIRIAIAKRKLNN